MLAPLAVSAAALLGGYLGFSALAAHRFLHPPRLVCDWHPGVLGLRYEEFRVEGLDGVELRGWMVRGDGGGGETVLVLHGYTRSRWDDKYVCPSVYMLAGMGFSVAVYDQRGHGLSGGYTTLGHRELGDALRVIRELRRLFPEETRRIGVLGFSLGGAVAVMLAASGEAPVEAVVADSPYMDIIESARGWIGRSPQPLRGLLRASFPVIAWLVSRRIGVPPEELRLYRYAAALRKPLLIVAGERDDLVPLASIRRFYEEARARGARVELWVTPSGHVESLRDDPRGYAERVGGFLEGWLRRGA